MFRSFLAGFFLLFPSLAAAKPNVIVVITDDQGYGDLGCHGNPKILTPNIDAFAKQSMQLRHFYVSPVCSPTRSSLMTGRYNYRTGVVDTANGRSMMHPDETTIARILADNGYRTGIFGKWHLGDNYPLRPQEHGFQECLVMKGGGLGQPSDLPGGSSYFDPILLHNGKAEKQKGYVSNVITDAAIDFVKADSEKPFFAYLAYNCPHTPLEIGDDDLKPYKEMNLAYDQFPKFGYPQQGKYNADDVAKIYAMISNIDANLGRLFKTLDDRKLTDNTIVIFMTDNGPQQPRYNAGLRGLKTMVYEGGVRVPFYARWPGKFPADKSSDHVAAHIDVLPTLLDACHISLPKGLKIDGISMLPALKGASFLPPDRTIFLQWHRGEVPDMNRGCMARSSRWKIVQAKGTAPGYWPKDAEFELYDILEDPYEEMNLAQMQPAIVKHMRKDYEAWFADVKKEREFLPPRIILGSDKENPSILTRQDWRGPNAAWTPTGEGFWEVSIDRPGKYRVTIHTERSSVPRMANIGFAGTTQQAKVELDRAVISNVEWKKGDGRLEAWIAESGKRYGAKYLEVERVGD